MAEAQEPCTPPPDRSRRAAIFATLGILVILGLAFFIGTVVAPLWQTHAAVRGYYIRPVAGDETVARLGGQERAAGRLVAYLHLPRWLKADQCTAATLLGYCGPQAVPTLVKTLEDTDAAVRACAAGTLGTIGSGAKEAMPGLEKLLQDPDKWVRKTAIWALKEIRASAPVPDAPEEAPPPRD